MKRIIITESQYNSILVKEDVYLHPNDGAESPDNAYGTQISVDVPETDNVTTADTVKRHKRGWLSPKGFIPSLEESQQRDNAQNSGLGTIADMKVQSAAQNGGKMVNNLNREIQSNQKGVRNNTLEVRASRLRAQKENDPVTYAKNGGKATEKAINQQLVKNKAAGAAMPESNDGGNSKPFTLPTETSKGGSKKPENNIYYFS